MKLRISGVMLFENFCIVNDMNCVCKCGENYVKEKIGIVCISNCVRWKILIKLVFVKLCLFFF